MGFSRQEWSGLPFPLPGDLPNPRIKSESPALQAYSLLLNHQGSPRMVSTHQQMLNISSVPGSVWEAFLLNPDDTL